MFDIVKKAYRLFFTHLPIILLLCIPLFLLSAIDIALFGGDVFANGSSLAWISAFVVALAGAATDISIYQVFFKYKKINPLRCPKAFLQYFVTQIIISVVAIIPVFVLQYLLSFFISSNGYILTIALLANFFIGFYILIRFNCVLPMIITQQIPSYKNFLTMTDKSYSSWILAAVSIFTPYIVLNYFIPNIYANMLLTTLALVLFNCFAASFVLENNLVKVSSVSVPLKTKTEPTFSKTEPASSQKQSSKEEPKAPQKKLPSKKKAETKTSATKTKVAKKQNDK